MTFYYRVIKPESREERFTRIFARNSQENILREDKVGDKTIEQRESEIEKEKTLPKFDTNYKVIKKSKYDRVDLFNARGV